MGISTKPLGETEPKKQIVRSQVIVFTPGKTGGVKEVDDWLYSQLPLLLAYFHFFFFTSKFVFFVNVCI